MSEVSSKAIEDARFAAWRTWKELCDYDRCPAEDRAQISEFVYRRLNDKLFQYEQERRQTGGFGTLRADDLFPKLEGREVKNHDLAFQLFQQHLIGKKIGGKQSKDWLFEAGTRSAVEGRATRVIKSVLFREITGEDRKGQRVKETFNPNAERTEAEESGYSSELLDAFYKRGVDQPFVLERYRERAEVVATQLFGSCSQVARVAWVAKRCNISTDDTRVNRSANVGRTKISQEWRAFLSAVDKALDAEGFEPGEGVELRCFLQMLAGALDDLMRKWSDSAENMHWADFIVLKQED